MFYLVVKDNLTAMCRDTLRVIIHSSHVERAGYFQVCKPNTFELRTCGDVWAVSVTLETQYLTGKTTPSQSLLEFNLFYGDSSSFWATNFLCLCTCWNMRYLNKAFRMIDMINGYTFALTATLIAHIISQTVRCMQNIYFINVSYL